MVQNVFNAYRNAKHYMKNNPKKVFVFSFCILMLMLVYNLFFNEHKYENAFTIPKLSVDTSIGIHINKLQENKENLKRLEEVMQELEEYKILRDKGLLTKKDSLRIKYLYEEFNKYK
ncbi:MAG: hypothetical protein Q4B43_07660 [Bacteroidota bacterium]|nr:hypothetical protein [Bacteroidota bacterium]